MNKNSNQSEAIQIDDLDATPSPNERIQENYWAPLRFLSGVAGLVILVLGVFISATVVLRMFETGVIGAVELSGLAMVFVTVLVVPAVTASDENFRVEIVDMFASARTVHGFNILGYIVQVLVLFFIVFATLDLFISDLNMGVTMAGELYLPRWWMTLVVFISFVATLYASIIKLAQALRTPAPKAKEV